MIRAARGSDRHSRRWLGRQSRRRAGDGAVEGPARVDRRTKDLARRLMPGEIAVIAHEDLDRVSAETLVERGAAAVVNADLSISGRYPNEGPLVLAKAGIPLIDHVGAEAFERIAEGDFLRVEGGRVLRRGRCVATGDLLQADLLDRRLAAAEGSVGEELERFVRNTMDYLSRERDLILQGVGIPEIATSLRGRHALVVVRGYDYKRDLRALRGYMREMRPAVVAVDGAADALLEEGFRPDLIVGDMDSVSTDALICGAELVVHAYPDGRAPGMDRVEALGLEAKVLRSGGTSEDVALLLAYEHGADPIVAVGTHMHLAEFLDKGRGGMASTFLVRLKVGPRLIDAKGVSRLYRSRIRRGDLFAMVAAALVSMLVIVAVSDPIRELLNSIPDWLHRTWFDLFR